MAEDVAIRAIEVGDVDTLRALMVRLAKNQDEDAYLKVTAETLRETGFGAKPKWRGFLAEQDGAAIGYATFTEDFHLWTGVDRITLDDLYVIPEARSAGVGARLLTQVIEEAEKTGAYLQWQVQTGNARAIAFYERLGARFRTVGKCDMWTAKK